MKRTVATIALGGLAVFAAPAYADQLPVNLASPGLVPIAVSDPGATVGGVSPSLNAGRIAHYDKQALIRAGALRASTDVLVASDGSVADVEPNVTLEVKLAQRSAAVNAVLDRFRAREVRAWWLAVDVDRLAAKARARTGRTAPAMEQWHHVELPAGADADAAARELLALPEVSFAYPAPGRRAAAAGDDHAVVLLHAGLPTPRAGRDRQRLLARRPPHARRGSADRRPRVLLDARSRGPAARPRRGRPRRHRLPAVPQLQRRARHRGVRRDGRQGQRLRRDRRRARRVDARHLADARAAAGRDPVHPVGGADLRRPVPLAR